MRRALSWREAGIGRIPAAQCRKLDHLRQRPAPRLAQHLPADRNRRQTTRRRPLPHALDQAQIDFESEGGETYIFGNPPYKGSQTQTKEQKDDLARVFDPYGISSKQIDYVGGWFMKAAAYMHYTAADSAFVSTNSICQGRIIPILWPKIFETGAYIHFAHTSFKWANLASHNAGVTVVIVGLSRSSSRRRRLFDVSSQGETTVRQAPNITQYLTIGENVMVTSKRKSIAGLQEMSFGNMPVDGGNPLLSVDEVAGLGLTPQ